MQQFSVGHCRVLITASRGGLVRLPAASGLHDVYVYGIYREIIPKWPGNNGKYVGNI